MQDAFVTAPWWYSVIHVVKTSVILIVLMLQVCHGYLADPDCGVSSEVLMVAFNPGAHIYTARHIVQRFTAAASRATMMM